MAAKFDFSYIKFSDDILKKHTKVQRKSKTGRFARLYNLIFLEANKNKNTVMYIREDVVVKMMRELNKRYKPYIKKLYKHETCNMKTRNNKT